MWRTTVAMGVRFLDTDQVRGLRRVIACFEELLAAGNSGGNLLGIFQVEISAARVMLSEIEQDLHG